MALADQRHFSYTCNALLGGGYDGWTSGPAALRKRRIMKRLP
jgi:hypothetical protein